MEIGRSEDFAAVPPNAFGVVAKQLERFLPPAMSLRVSSYSPRRRQESDAGGFDFAAPRRRRRAGRSARLERIQKEIGLRTLSNGARRRGHGTGGGIFLGGSWKLSRLGEVTRRGVCPQIDGMVGRAEPFVGRIARAIPDIEGFRSATAAVSVADARTDPLLVGEPFVGSLRGQNHSRSRAADRAVYR